MARLNPAAITTAPSQEPFTLQPLIRQMLSTRRCISGSIFIVEGIDVIPVPAATPEDDDSHAVRLVLGDGELCIQALLHPDMFDLVEKKDVFVGCCVRVGDFVMRFEEPEADGQNLFDQGEEEDEEEDEREKREKDDEKGMVYLIVNELETAGWNESYMAMWRRHEKGKGAADAEDAGDAQQPAVVTGKVSTDEQLARESQGTASEEAQTTTPKASRPRRGVVRFADPQASPSVQTPTKARFQDKGKAQTPRPLDDDDEDDDEDDLENAFEAFEARTFPARKTTPKKPAASSNARETTTAAAAASEKSQQQQQQQQQPIALAKDWHDRQAPLKLTTLRLIPHLPYAQNWSVNVLAIVASLSPVEPSHLAPGRQRTARIADPSTAKQVHLTVFLDPDGFTPRVGSAVLLVGVKNHRFDGGSLKKDRRWWFEDPWDMSWLDVAGIKSWWQGVEEYYRTGG
ncbi:hypothetical protein N5P37_011646 [Trichoderma harzianum]|uniref:Uncharacterized protein n=1 Tax=Trichoderma harzianum CBS 226.95 TaxID=983964 RepID=A0A2T3ZXM4_TRIHA|nr:hypothetical protein M431DRAFT_97148 [Trichoderma harzianum CBS 226.95]KAK0755772.1 hypothetical protein N5P37_011646 [Trichoderma harzianum]PTB49566.1 hypothetical protein M431DRAFT_97148 [Trichoderma harzianum CBS 226.95]